MDLPDLKKCHLGRVSFKDLILEADLDPPKVAQEGSRCSLSSVFASSAGRKIGQNRSPKWTMLRSEISTTLLLEGTGSDLGCHSSASGSKLRT